MKDFRKVKSCVAMLLLLFGFFMLVGPVMADEAEKSAPPEEEKPTASLSVDFLNQYIFRGVALSKDSAVIQPSITAGYKGFSVNVWGNLDTSEHNPFTGNTSPGAKWNETDFTFTYTHELFCKGLNASVGGVYYSLNPLDTFEVFGGLSYALPWLTAGVSVYRDIAHFPGTWIQIDLGRNFVLPWYGMNVDLGASFGYTISDDVGSNPDQSTGHFSDWTSCTLSAGLNVPIGKYIVISPKVGFATPLSADAADRIKGLSWDGRENHVFGGLRVAASF